MSMREYIKSVREKSIIFRMDNRIQKASLQTI